MEALELNQYTIKRRVGALLGRNLSPRTMDCVRSAAQFGRFRWWCLSSYFPRLVASGFVKRTPQVRGFGASLSPLHVTQQLQSVNMLAPTRMCHVMTKYGSDKGRLNNYTPLYWALFEERCGQPL